MALHFRVCHVALALAALAAAAVPAHAQFRAALQGTVTDASGGAVPGVAVVAVNAATGVATETVTGEAGFYRLSGLPPGTYTVTAKLEGFKEAVAERVVVGAEEARGLDLVLETGSLTETVTVTAAPGTLRTENAEISGTLADVERVDRSLDLEGAQRATERTDRVGTRHRSVYRLCQRLHDAFAIVVSQDGGVRFVRWHAGAVTYFDQIATGPWEV